MRYSTEPGKGKCIEGCVFLWFGRKFGDKYKNMAKNW